MKAAEIIEAATAEGLVVDLSPGGSLKAIGAREAVNRWLPLLKQHKAEILDLLRGEQKGAVTPTRPLPLWCRADCPGLETIPLPDEGEVAGCVHPVTETWRRLDRLTGCPAMAPATATTLPSWCRGSRCEHFHRLTILGIGTVVWCCWEQDSTHWRRVRIDAMNSCPMEAKP